jgi:hypothetical protein
MSENAKGLLRLSTSALTILTMVASFKHARAAVFIPLMVLLLISWSAFTWALIRGRKPS